MTANELADKLMSSLTMEYDCDKYMEQASTMLRQQQSEIEALRLCELTDDEIKEVYDQYFDVDNFGWLQRECIREILQKAREKND